MFTKKNYKPVIFFRKPFCYGAQKHAFKNTVK